MNVINTIFYYLGDSSFDANTLTIIGGTIGGVALFVFLSILLCVGIWRIRVFKEKMKLRNYSEFFDQNSSSGFNSNPLCETELMNMKTDKVHSGVEAGICKYSN